MERILDSAWGEVHRCCAIAPEVYQVEASWQPEGCSISLPNGGLMIPTEAAARLLPSKALAYGERSEHRLFLADDAGERVVRREFLHYERDGSQLIALYELLSRRAITDYDIIRSYNEHDLVNQGRFHLPEYFGELFFPVTLYFRIDDLRRLDNGIWAVCQNGSHALVVHKTVADYCMSPVAPKFAKRIGNSLVFMGNQAVIALYELYSCSLTLRERIGPPNEIVEVLKTQCGLYLALSGADPDSLFEHLRGA